MDFEIKEVIRNKIESIENSNLNEKELKESVVEILNPLLGIVESY